MADKFLRSTFNELANNWCLRIEVEDAFLFQCKRVFFCQIPYINNAVVREGAYWTDGGIANKFYYQKV